MSDPFRRLFLDQLDLILKKEPSTNALLEMLQLANPGLDRGDLKVHTEKKRAMRTLLTRVHPDKHPQDVVRATRLCQDAQTFHDKCSASTPRSRKKAKSASPTSVALPLKFKVADKWPHAQYGVPYLEDPQDLTDAERSALVAYQCINARGAIAHGKEVELQYRNKQAMDLSKMHHDVEAIFNSHGGCKELYDVESIKEEIQNNGPVVSTSFSPSKALLQQHNVLRDQHDVLITGWSLCEYGEVWLVQPLHHLSNSFGASVVRVAIGQFGIDDLCLAPANSFENQPWETGPYFDANMASCPEWRSSTSIKIYYARNQFMNCLEQAGTIVPGATKITIRDESKHAHTKKGILQSMEWGKEKKEWKISCNFL